MPTVAPGDIVVMDNLPAQRLAGVRTAIEAGAAIGRGTDAFTPADCVNYFAAAGCDCD